MQCPSCGAPIVSETARFCRGCGAKVHTPPVCAVCGLAASPGARFCRGCGARIDLGAPTVAAPAGRTRAPRRPRKMAAIATAGAATLVLAGLAAITFLLVGRDDEPAGGSATPGPSATGELVESLRGTGSVQATPAEGGVVTAGIARVEVRPLALAQPATVSAALNADRSLDITMEPAGPLLVPALVTFPLPPGAKAGDDPSTWPVVLLEAPGEDPLVLEPEAVSDSTFAVLLPHFSKATPMLQAAANAKTGGATPGSGTPYMPATIRASVSLPETGDPNAQVGQVLVNVTAAARTAAHGGLPEMEGGQLAPGWERFKRLRVRVYDTKENLRIGVLPIGEGEIVNGQPVTIRLSVDWGPEQLRAAFIRLEDEDGRLLVVRSIALPNGKYWKELQCKDAGEYDDFTIHYLWDPRSTGYPDNGYTAQASPRNMVPARVFDACEALTYAYGVFRNPRWFGAANAPSLPIEVWLQPWRENESGNVRNWISLRTSPGSYDEFKRDAAHELAHRFQHQYSIGYGGGWFHEASAEYLANRIYDPDEAIGHFIGLTPAWISSGLIDGADIDAYSSSSFLAYLSSVYGINVAKLWTEGATGFRNFQSWQSYLNSLLLPKTNNVGISKAWDDFSKAYLVDHTGWGDWSGVALDAVFVAKGSITLGGGKPYYGVQRRPAPFLSGGATLVKFSGAPSATIVYRVTVYGSRWGHYWVNPGVTVDGRGDEIRLDDTRPPQKTGAVRVGSTKGAFDDKGVLRLSHSFGDFEGGNTANSELMLEAWALPEPVGVEQSDVGGLLEWPASPVEKLADSEKRGLFDGYELVAQKADGKWAVLQRIAGGKDTYEYTIDAAAVAKAGASLPVCVRVRDILGNTGTEGCPAAGATSWAITSAAFARTGTITEPSMVRGGLVYWEKAEANPTACRIDIEEWSTGTEVTLACVFVPGCAADLDCFSWTLASDRPDLSATLSVAPTAVKGEMCNGRSDSTCIQEEHIDATISGNQMQGEFGIVSSYRGTSGAITVTFTAVPRR
ncbi:MAG: zinc ribbon domain-containing protein [Dehalococcoidia bacterium]|nr:zinc ribbon domain-containing protein [Dehalococcoidia bacterium]